MLYPVAEGTASDTASLSCSEAEIDSVYQSLREMDLENKSGLKVSGLEFEADSFRFTLSSGELYLLARPWRDAAIIFFHGGGQFSYRPVNENERAQAKRFTGEQELSVKLESAFLVSTDASLNDLLEGLNFTGISPSHGARSAYRSIRKMGGGEVFESSCILVMNDLVNRESPGRLRAVIDGTEMDAFLLINDSSQEEPVQIFNLSLRGYPDDFFHWWISDTDTSTTVSEQAGSCVDIERTELAVEIEGELLSAEARLHGIVNCGPLKGLLLYLAPQIRINEARDAQGRSLTIIQSPHEKKVTLGGIRHAGSSQVLVILREEVNAGDSLVLFLTYSCEDVVVSMWNGGYRIEDRFHWYPKTSLFDPGMIDARFTFPSEKVLITSGRLVHADTSSRKSTTHWRSPLPVPVFGFNYGDFTCLDLDEEGTIVVCSHPEFFRPRQSTRVTQNLAKRVAKKAQRVRGLYEDYFGPLPYDTVYITQQPQGFSAQCFTSLVFLPFTSFLSKGQKSLRLRAFTEDVLPHEIAHLWWGNLVVPKTYKDIWLSEGLAQFALGLFIEYDQGKKAASDFWKETRDKITTSVAGKSAYELGPLSLGRRLSGRDAPRLYEWLVYNKGAYVIHMLRMMMKHETGDEEVFKKTLQAFISRYKGTLVSTEDFVRVVEEYVEYDMEWFFNQWIDGTYIPHYRFDQEVIETPDGTVSVILEITDTGAPSSFRMPVPYMIRVADEVRWGSVLVTGESAVDTIQLSSRPEEILWNPSQAVLCTRNSPD